MTDMHILYKPKMARFGWNKITIVRTAISTMADSRGMQIATVTLNDTLPAALMLNSPSARCPMRGWAAERDRR